MAEKVNKSFTQLKELIVIKRMSMQYKEDNIAYYVFVVDDIGTTYQADIYKSTFLASNVIIGLDVVQNAIDEQDFTTNYKSICDQNISSNVQKTNDNRQSVYSTSRPVGTHTYFASEGDDPTYKRSIGGGTQIMFDHKSGQQDLPLYIDFNVEENTTYIHEGYIFFEGCNFDQISMHFVPQVTSYIQAANTNFNLVDGYLIVPAAGNGTIQLTENPKLVLADIGDDGTRVPGFWDADWNSQTLEYENIRPNVLGQGLYNIFGTEVIFYRMVQQIILLGNISKVVHLETCEQGYWLPGLRLKIWNTTHLPDHDYKMAGILVLYRDKVTQTA
jgi:hypothetical protein